DRIEDPRPIPHACGEARRRRRRARRVERPPRRYGDPVRIGGAGESVRHRQFCRRAFLLEPEGVVGRDVAHRHAPGPGVANGVFVAAEFAIVTVRKTRIDQLIAEGNRRARAVRRAISDPDSYIAATQLGITMASIGLGWIGEPALASMIQPAFAFLPVPVAEA